LIQWTYCVHTCFYIVLIFKKYQHVITVATNLCNYICNYTADPSLILKGTLKPTHTTTLVPNLTHITPQ